MSTDEAEADLLTTLWGNNARYGTRTINGVNWQVYFYEYGDANSRPPTSNRGLACGTGKTWYLKMQDWHHVYDGTCPSGRERWKFERN